MLSEQESNSDDLHIVVRIVECNYPDGKGVISEPVSLQVLNEMNMKLQQNIAELSNDLKKAQEDYQNLNTKHAQVLCGSVLLPGSISRRSMGSKAF